MAIMLKIGDSCKFIDAVINDIFWISQIQDTHHMENFNPRFHPNLIAATVQIPLIFAASFLFRICDDLSGIPS
jgi:hypothetical protein